MHPHDFVALIFNDFLQILLFFKIKIKIVFGDLQPKHFRVITFNN